MPIDIFVSETNSGGTNFVRPSAGELRIVMLHSGAAGVASVTLTPAPLGNTTGPFFYTFDPVQDPSFGLLNGSGMGNAPVTIPVLPFTDDYSGGGTIPPGPDYILYIGTGTVGGRVGPGNALYAVQLHFIGTGDYQDSQNGLGAVVNAVWGANGAAASWGSTKYEAFRSGVAQAAPYGVVPGTVTIPMSSISPHRFGFNPAGVPPFNPNAPVTIPLHTYGPATAFATDLATDPDTATEVTNWFNALTNAQVAAAYAAAGGGLTRTLTFNLGAGIPVNYGFLTNALGRTAVTGTITFNATPVPPANAQYNMVFVGASLSIQDIWDFNYFNAIFHLWVIPNFGPLWAASVQAGAHRAGIAPAAKGEVTMIRVNFTPALAINGVK